MVVDELLERWSLSVEAPNGVRQLKVTRMHGPRSRAMLQFTISELQVVFYMDKLDLTKV